MQHSMLTWASWSKTSSSIFDRAASTQSWGPFKVTCKQKLGLVTDEILSLLLDNFSLQFGDWNVIVKPKIKIIVSGRNQRIFFGKAKLKLNYYS